MGRHSEGYSREWDKPEWVMKVLRTRLGVLPALLAKPRTVTHNTRLVAGLAMQRLG